MSPFASTTSILQMSSYMDSHKVYPTVCKNSEGKSWRDHLGSAILKLSTILKATTRDSTIDVLAEVESACFGIVTRCDIRASFCTLNTGINITAIHERISPKYVDN